MNFLFLSQVALSFCIGGAFVVCSLMLAERFGSTVGGVLAGLPSTAAISLFFIGVTSGIEIAVVSAGILPMIVGFSGLFLVSYAALSRANSPEVALLYSMIFWLTLSSISFLFSPIPFVTNLVIFLLIFSFSGFVVLRWLDLPVFEGSKSTRDRKSFFRRGLLSGTIIATSVIAAKFGGPVFGAILAGFPAVFFSTMWVASRSYGVAFSHSLITPLLFSGLTNVTCYAIAVRFFYPRSGLIAGTLASYAVSLISGFLVFKFVKLITLNKRIQSRHSDKPFQA